MKRHFLLILMVALLIPCLIVPASATTQGVIDAIEEQTDNLGEWLGVGLGDIRDILESIDESLEIWLDSICTSLVDIYSTVTDGIYVELQSFGDSITGLYEYFCVKSSRSVQYIEVGSTNGVAWVAVRIKSKSITPFIYDLNTLANPGIDWFAQIARYFLGIYYGEDYQTNIDKTTEVDDGLSSAETQVDEWVDSMETAPTIVIEDIETEVEKVTEFETDATFVGILGSIFLNEVFLTMFTWSIILAMLGYILYGKR